MNLKIAKTIETAVTAASAATEFRAGGTDVQERVHHGQTAATLIDIRRVDGLNRIAPTADGGLAIGALVTLDEIATHPRLLADYPGLAQAAGGLATPQIRWMATLGGALLQRTRCHYFRHPSFDCFKSGGDGCPAREGHNPNGVIFDLGPCAYPHPATLGMVLLAYEAQIKIEGADALRSAAALYGDGRDPHQDHALRPGELLTHVILPPPTAGEQAAYFRSISRSEAEWPIVETVVRLVITDGIIRFARVGVGGVANIPLRLPLVEAALLGQAPTPETLAQAAGQAAVNANPLPQTAYKVDFLVGTVLEGLERVGRSE